VAQISTIADVHAPWRDALLPASFRGALFHVDAGSRESGRRIVVHEFPKKDIPYSEDMGRRARAFTVRGYCITYPFETPVRLYSVDYRKARDDLIDALESADGPSVLQLPTLPPMTVVCPQYRWVEEERLGGYCVFDMTFVEYGQPPRQPQPSSSDNLRFYSDAMKDRIQQVMTGADQRVRDIIKATPAVIPPP
jgi:hypothetical protein